MNSKFFKAFRKEKQLNRNENIYNFLKIKNIVTLKAFIIIILIRFEAQTRKHYAIRYEYNVNSSNFCFYPSNPVVMRKNFYCLL